MSGKVFLVGAGPGDPGLLTQKAARAIAACDTLVYDYLAADPIVALARPGCEKIYVGKKAGAHTLSQQAITELIVRLGKEGRRVVRLKGGDVFVFARGGEEAQALHDAGVPFEIIPGITSAIAAPAYAGIPITHRDHNTAFTIATGHEDPTKGFSSLDFAKLANPAQTLVFLMAMGNLVGIVAQLIANGLREQTPVAIVREGTKPTQETIVATLGTIVAEVERRRFGAPAIVVIGEVVGERERTRWFDLHPLFGKRLLITRPAGAGDEFAASLWEVGAQPVLAPTIAIVPPDDEAAALRAVHGARAYGWIVFTSANGVHAFFERLSTAHRDARALGDVRVAAIGPKTAAILASYGVKADLVPPVYVGEALAAALLEQTHAGERVLLFCAQEAREVLGETLRDHDRLVDTVAAYKTIPIHDTAIADAAQTCDIWTFTSASAVHSFVENLEIAAQNVGVTTRAGEKIVACIGPITAEAARRCGLAVDVVAEHYTVEGLAAALGAHAARE
ncbi:MAG TPA: uroporphyrinogen-III C-methyltransferase [Candidatus Acidoferrales bacterium]|nr:uroporphyrinogen-III C-methyltransferase [Candidatus Acidoferrales bacterium]